MKQHESGHLDVSMRSCSWNTKPIKFQIFQSGAGELGWLTRQLTYDLCYENGVVQRAKGDACIADPIKLKHCLAQAKRTADFRLRYWADVDYEMASWFTLRILATQVVLLRKMRT